jgi:hypothetical protein
VVGLAEIEFPFTKLKRKEADLLVSRAYGSGRHDLEYEEKGIDHPFNFMQLLAQKKMDVKSLVSHIFPIKEVRYGG